MAWGRLALIQATGDNEAALPKVAELFGYVLEQREDALPLSDGQRTEDRGQTVVEKTVAPRVPAPRVPAVFVAVSQFEALQEADDSPRGYLADEKRNLKNLPIPAGSYQFAAPETLLPLARLLPFLHNALGQQRHTGRLDHRRLATRMAQGKALKRLPFLPRQYWPQRLQIIVDASLSLEPFWGDFAFLIEGLQKLLGEEAVEAIRFDEDSQASSEPLCLRWPTREEDSWRFWRVPAEDVAVLILSDLGMGEAHFAARVRWQRLLQRLQNRRAPLLTLSPAAVSPFSLSLCRVAKPNPLNDAYALPRHPLRKGFKLAVAKERLLDILALLSPLPLVDGGLLRRLRVELDWGGSELETLVWNHADIQQHGLGICVQAAAVERHHARYLQKFKNTAQARRMWQLVGEHHRGAFEGLRQLEALNHCVIENVADAVVNKYFQNLCATLEQEKDSPHYAALLAQCHTALALVPKALWRTDLEALKKVFYDLYALAYADDIEAGNWQGELPQGFEIDRVKWVLKPEAQQRQRWCIEQANALGGFCCRKVLAGEDLSLAVAEFSAHAGLPPILAYEGMTASPSRTGSHQVLADGQSLQLSAFERLTISSPFQQLELLGLQKPDWALGIGRDADGLFITVPEDEYGLYADFQINGIVQRFRWIEAGTFMMGSPESEIGRLSKREDFHQVTLTEGFWLADTTVTQALWLAVMGNNPSDFKDDVNNPVERVSWDDAQIFIEKINALFPEVQFSLPSEAQWEYACRAGTQTPFSFGDNITPEQVNYDGEYPYANAKKGLYRQKTVAVKSLPPNAWGLYEMHGNVWEWCRDGWQENLGKQAVTDPVQPVNNDSPGRVVRGGSWFNRGLHVRSAYRGRLGAGDRGHDVGFRLSLGLQAKQVQVRQQAAFGESSGSRVSEQRQAEISPKAKPRFFDNLKNTFKHLWDK